MFRIALGHTFLAPGSVRAPAATRAAAPSSGAGAGAPPRSAGAEIELELGAGAAGAGARDEGVPARALRVHRRRAADLAGRVAAGLARGAAGLGALPVARGDA